MTEDKNIPHIAAVAPVLNEQENVPELVRRLGHALGVVSQDYWIVLVDDGSSDATWSKIMASAEENTRVLGLRLSRNFGQHIAIAAGLKAVDADWTVVLDGDLQDRPEVIPELYEKAQQGHDVVFVARESRPESVAYKVAQGVFYKTLRTMTGADYNPAHGNFSIISRTVLFELNKVTENDRFYGGLVEWLGFRRATLKAKHGERFAGNTSYSLLSRIKFAKNIILSFSIRPLYAAVVFGAVVTALSFIFGLVILFKALFLGYAVQGWPSMMVSIYFVGGVQMLMIGMNGLYVGRIAEEVKNRPLYVVADTTDQAP